jgi:hypothetical protein
LALFSNGFNHRFSDSWALCYTKLDQSEEGSGSDEGFTNLANTRS